MVNFEKRKDFVPPGQIVSSRKARDYSKPKLSDSPPQNLTWTARDEARFISRLGHHSNKKGMEWTQMCVMGYREVFDATKKWTTAERLTINAALIAREREVGLL